jgi:hypothetical protein
VLHDADKIIDDARVCEPRQPALPNKQERDGGARQRRTCSPSGGDCGSFDDQFKGPICADMGVCYGSADSMGEIWLHPTPSYG